MKRSLYGRLFGVVSDFWYLSKKDLNPIKAFDREFCVAHRQFEALPISNIKIVVDIGAHLGLFSKRISKIFDVDKLILVEPLSEQAEMLKAIKLPKSEVHTLALSDIEGIGQFRINECLQASSLLQINSTIATQETEIDCMNEVSMVEVNLKRLDNLLTESNIDVVDILKLDTQGYELNILKGCGLKLESVRLIQIELLFEQYYIGAALFPEIHDFLHLKGFVLHRLFDFSVAKDGRILYCDGWYVNTKKFE